MRTTQVLLLLCYISSSFSSNDSLVGKFSTERVIARLTFGQWDFYNVRSIQSCDFKTKTHFFKFQYTPMFPSSQLLIEDSKSGTSITPELVKSSEDNTYEFKTDKELFREKIISTDGNGLLSDESAIKKIVVLLSDGSYAKSAIYADMWGGKHSSIFPVSDGGFPDAVIRIPASQGQSVVSNTKEQVVEFLNEEYVTSMHFPKGSPSSSLKFCLTEKDYVSYNDVLPTVVHPTWSHAMALSVKTFKMLTQEWQAQGINISEFRMFQVAEKKCHITAGHQHNLFGHFGMRSMFHVDEQDSELHGREAALQYAVKTSMNLWQNMFGEMETNKWHHLIFPLFLAVKSLNKVFGGSYWNSEILMRNYAIFTEDDYNVDSPHTGLLEQTYDEEDNKFYEQGKLAVKGCMLLLTLEAISPLITDKLFKLINTKKYTKIDQNELWHELEENYRGPVSFFQFVENHLSSPDIICIDVINSKGYATVEEKVWTPGGLLEKKIGHSVPVKLTFVGNNSEQVPEIFWLKPDDDQLEIHFGNTYTNAIPIVYSLGHGIMTMWDTTTWTAINNALLKDHTHFPPPLRAYFIWCATMLASSGDLSLKIFLTTLEYLKNEDHLHPWKVASNCLNFIFRKIQGSGAEIPFKGIVRALMSTRFTSVNLTPIKTVEQKMLKEIFIELGILVGSPEVSKMCHENFASIQNSDGPFGFISVACFRMVLKEGGPVETNFVTHLWEKSQGLYEWFHLTHALIHAKNEATTERLLMDIIWKHSRNKWEHVAELFSPHHPTQLLKFYYQHRLQLNTWLDETVIERLLGKLCSHLTSSDLVLLSQSKDHSVKGKEKCVLRLQQHGKWLKENEQLLMSAIQSHLESLKTNQSAGTSVPALLKKF